MLRRLLGGVGELLITAGILILLFLVWQLWWTDLIAGREHDEVISHLGWEDRTQGERIAPEHHELAPAVDQPTEEGTVWGVLHVPEFDHGAETPIAEGVSREKVLNVKGAGHYPETVMPGQVGNFSLAGHRTTYGKPFHEIADLEAGDPVVVETEQYFYVYEVVSAEVVYPDQVEVIAPVPDDAASQAADATAPMMTMTACHPMFSARQRYVVHLKFDYWTDRDEGTPAPLVTP